MELDIPPDEETTPDLKFTVEKVNCIGACGIAPVTVLNKEVHGKMTLDKLMKEIKENKVRIMNKDIAIKVCTGTGGVASGGEEVLVCIQECNFFSRS